MYLLQVSFAVSQSERQLETMEQAVRVELFGHRPKSKEKAEKFNIYSAINEADGTVTRAGKPERIRRLKTEEHRLRSELEQLSAKVDEQRQQRAAQDAGGADADGDGDDDGDEQQLSEEQLTEEVQAKSKQLQKLKTVLAATKARISAMGAERAKNISKIVNLLEDSDAKDAQVQALQVRTYVRHSRPGSRRRRRRRRRRRGWVCVGSELSER